MIDLLPRARRLELVHPHVSNSEYLALEKRKATDLTEPVVRALKKAKRWVHPMLRFVGDAAHAPFPTALIEEEAA